MSSLRVPNAPYGSLEGAFRYCLTPRCQPRLDRLRQNRAVSPESIAHSTASRVTSRPMRHISLLALYVGLNDLLERRLPALGSFPSGAASIKLFKNKRNALSKLPAVTAGRPLVDELDTTDARHDALGHALYHFTEAYTRNPDTPAPVLDAVKKIRAAFIPTLEDLGASYAAEAKAAMDRRPDLTNLQAELAMFPVVGGGTLRDWAENFLNAGMKIDELLSQRADIEKQNRKDAGRMRVELIGLLNRLRKTLEAELNDDPALPRDLDARVFGYLDLLEEHAATAFARGQSETDLPAPDGATTLPAGAPT